MFNFDYIQKKTYKNIIQIIRDYPYTILIVRDSQSGKAS